MTAEEQKKTRDEEHDIILLESMRVTFAAWKIAGFFARVLDRITVNTSHGQGGEPLTFWARCPSRPAMLSATVHALWYVAFLIS